MADPTTRTLNLLILMPENKREPIHRTRVIGAMEMPRWGGSLYFRNARLEEADHLKTLYEDAWNNKFTEKKPITISAEQIRSCIENFPQGQIVGCERPKKGETADDVPVSMINIMLAALDPKKLSSGQYDGYEKVTDGRTFAQSIKPGELFELAERSKGEILPSAFCVSIAVPKQFQGGSYAFQTLKYAVIFSEVNGVIPAPYSAPRGFASALMKNSSLEIMDYLHKTAPIRKTAEKSLHDMYLEYFSRMGVISDRIGRAFKDHTILFWDLFEKYQKLPADPLDCKVRDTAFARFQLIDSPIYSWKFGRELTIEDFCILTGRALIDPVIGMHVGNGARFIRDQEGKIIAVFKDSRPEDLAANGYNIILSYGYHPLLGHKFSTDAE